MGVKVKPSGERRLQPVVDRFFYWLRASTLETRRLANWWADRMVATNRPLEEKMALFWHGHFATGEDKVRDYRKMRASSRCCTAYATGNFRELLIEVAQDPAMLVFLDAGQNVKGAPNENFGREVMELFTMGVGNYTEQDIREGARAFTGWIDDDLVSVDPAKHDDGDKTFLGRTGNFDGVDILDIILEQKVTADSSPASSTAFWCATTCRRRCRSGSAPCCATTTTRSRRSCARSSCRATSTARLGRHAHQGTGRADRLDLSPAWAQGAAGHSGFQRGERRAGAIAAQPADGGRVGAGPRLDHPRHLAGARQFRPRCRVARHDQLHRSEPDPGPADPPGQHAHPGRHGYQRRQERGRGRRQRRKPAGQELAGEKAWPTC